MQLYHNLVERKESIAIIGLGYVGMPLAVSFAKVTNVIGFDLNKEKIRLYKNGIDPTNEVGNNEISNTEVIFTSNEKELRKAKFHIVSVPTPINLDKTPNLEPIENASRIIGRNLTKGSVVVYESTVYPGATEDICIPILEEESNLKYRTDFKVGYSPERINPGDKKNTVENIIKIVSGSDIEVENEIAEIYKMVVKAGVHKTGSIKVAEAAKVVENSQRDINIAFMNELAMVFDKMDINTKDVIEAMNTKWNALKFYPGLVGGHCIGVDPYYFLYEAERLGYHSQIIMSGRKINDGVGEFIADNIIKKLINTGNVVKNSKVVIMGLTFKENTPDTRNSKVIDIIKKLKEYDIKPILVDPVADRKEAKRIYGIDIVERNSVNDADCVCFAVAHKEFLNLSFDEIEGMFKKDANEKKVFIDVKSIFDKKLIEEKGYFYWNL